MSEAEPPAPPTPESATPNVKHVVALFGGIALTIAFLVFFFEEGLGVRVPEWIANIPDETKPWGKRDWDARLGDLTLMAAVGIAGYGVVRRYDWSQTPGFQRLARGALIVLLLLSSSIYFYARRANLPSYGHRWDTYHYLLGAKYYEELDYYGLYDCTVEAMGKKRVPDKTRVRNLRTYALGNAKQARERSNCEEEFGPERWAQFKADIEAYIEFSSARYLRDMMRDHGYNGTPFHATVAGTIANRFDVSLQAINRVALFDTFGLCAMGAIITWAFGWKLGLVFAIYFFTNFVDRSGATGASFIRVQWMACLGISMAFLHRKRYDLSAGFLVVSAMLNVFPVLFAGAILGKMGLEYYRERDLRPEYKSWLKAAVITTVACGTLSVAYGNGVSNYSHFFENMEHHSQGPPTKDGGRRERIPGYGVGLKFTYLYRGEHHKKSLNFSKKKKSDQFKEIRWIYEGTAWFLVGLSLLIALRLDDLEGSILVGFTAFFCLLGTVGYYFACASLLVVLWQKRAASPLGLLMIALFFGCNYAAHHAYVASQSADVAHNTVMSYVWLFYLLVTLAILGHETGVYRDVAQRLFAPRFSGDEAA